MESDLVGSTMMKAAIFYGTQDIRIEEVDVPDIGADEALLRVRAVSICGTCYQCIQGNDHVCANYEALGINLDGAFAEYMRVPDRAIKRGHLVAVPAGVSFEEAALIEPFSCCYNGSRACRIEPGDAALVIGAGPIGIMHIFLARLSGTQQVLVSEMSDERLNRAVELGADLGVH